MADLFAVASPFTWDGSATTHWSATTGGAGGAGVPASNVRTHLDGNSGTGSIQLGADVTTFQTVCTGFAGTLDFNGHAIIAAGPDSNAWDGSTAMAVAGTPIVNLTYSGSVGVRTLQPLAVSEANAVSFNVKAGSDSVNILTNGSALKNLDFTGFTGTWAALSAHTIYGNLTLVSGMTMGSGTVATSFRATSGTQTITSAGKTIDWPLIVNAPGAIVTCADALTQGSTRAFTFTDGTLKLKAGATSTVGALATSTTAKTLQSTTAGTQAALSQASGTVNFTNTTIKDIAFTGGATFNALRSRGNVDGGGNTGINFGPAVGPPPGMSVGMGMGL